MKKLASRNSIEPPAAKRDKFGNLVTSRESLEKLYLDTYKERLQPNTIASDIKETSELKEYLLSLQFKLAKSRISKDWTL